MTTTIDTLDLIARSVPLSTYLGREARIVTALGTVVIGVLESIVYNTYYVIRTADGRTARTDSTVHLMGAA